MNLKPIIGLEIHVQLKTQSKMFCSCNNNCENKPINSCVCEICLGHPGTLPVTNKKAIKWSIKTALALNCHIAKETKFDRKHYFYPDLPKAYQISQYDKPIGNKGFLEINKQKIRINRLHLEEDAAKLIHPKGKNYTLVDYNRSGTPLMEIVTEPDLKDPKNAGAFLRELRAIIRVLEVSDADMEKGQLRCDANISLQNLDDDPKKLNPKTEIKNLNSFKAVEKALAYEIKRQKMLWDQGKAPKIQTTRGWDEAKGKTVEQRQKEKAHDYRYFPEPDIPPIVFANNPDIDIKKIKKSLPELPHAKRIRFVNQYNFSWADVSILTKDYTLANYIEKIMSELQEWEKSLDQENKNSSKKLAKLTANWLINELAQRVNHKWPPKKITPENFAEFIILIAKGKISAKAGQKVLDIMLKQGSDPSDIIEQENLTQVKDKNQLEQIIKKIITNNKKAVKQYQAGKTNVIKFLIGAVMRETKGRANPQIVEKLLEQKLKND